MQRSLNLVIDKAIPWIREPLAGLSNITALAGADISADAVRKADALIVRTRTRCDRSLLGKSAVSFIGSPTIGTDHIDGEWCNSRGIVWKNAPGCNALAVMQYVVSAILHLSLTMGRETDSLTIGIIGAGHTGSAVAVAARAFGMRVLLNDPPRERAGDSETFTPVRQLVAEADIISLHVPLTHTGRYATIRMANRDFTDAMKRQAWLINSSRGEVVYEDDIKRSIDRGDIAGYVADVWSSEPFIDTELADMSELATPHIAGYSVEGKLNGSAKVLRELSGHFGLPVEVPDRDMLARPERPLIEIAQRGGSFTEQIALLVCETFDIKAESSALKSGYRRFEEMRDSYRPRREFSAYQVAAGDHIEKIAKKLGFRT